MKTCIIWCFLFAALVSCSGVYAQHSKEDSKTALEIALKRFPGFDTAQMRLLLIAHKHYCIPLPTWLPEGFSVEKVVTRIGKTVKQENKELYITYSKQLSNGKKQSFTIEAGIDGIGDLLYQTTHTIKSQPDLIGLCYEPRDETGTKTLKRYVRSQWFDCNGTAYAYGSCLGASGRSGYFVMISLADTKKILASLQKF